MDQSLEHMIRKAEAILGETKEELLQMVSDQQTVDYQGPRAFLAFFEEDAKYRLRAVGLPEKELKHYLARICDIFGPYSEDQPGRSRPYYDNDLYT